MYQLRGKLHHTALGCAGAGLSDLNKYISMGLGRRLGEGKGFPACIDLTESYVVML